LSHSRKLTSREFLLQDGYETVTPPWRRMPPGSNSSGSQGWCCWIVTHPPCFR